eukprot:6706-Heterococcus_DN1.PRE.2
MFTRSGRPCATRVQQFATHMACIVNMHMHEQSTTRLQASLTAATVVYSALYISGAAVITTVSPPLQLSQISLRHSTLLPLSDHCSAVIRSSSERNVDMCVLVALSSASCSLHAQSQRNCHACIGMHAVFTWNARVHSIHEAQCTLTLSGYVSCRMAYCHSSKQSLQTNSAAEKT